MNCGNTVANATLALDGSLRPDAARDVAEHAGVCDDCATYVTQMATTAGLLASRRPDALPARATSASRLVSGEPDSAIGQMHRSLTALARAADPAHAEDLVQETWDHVLSEHGAPTAQREQLTAHLLGLIREHAAEHADAEDAWAADLLNQHRHHPADLAETDLPADPASYADLRLLADQDRLDPDADQAELLFPDLYGDGPETRGWTSPPIAWPSMSRILSPEDEAQTSELYAVVDAALDELAPALADSVYVVDIEGHSPLTASSLLHRGVDQIQRDLIVARNHVRGRVDAYLAQR